MAKIARNLGYEGNTNCNSFRYLEVPIHKGKKKLSYWKGLVEKIRKKIHSLGANWLNPTRKLILINIVLKAYPIYSCSISLAPKSIIQDIEKEIKRFLWQGGEPNGTKKFHLINWETVCMTKCSGGEAIEGLAAMNLAVGAKIV